MYKVLLVDDEIFVRRGLMNLMDWKALGYEICGEAENGAEALKQIERLKPDVVMADIRMPMLDGLELIRAVAEKQQESPAFIIVSGFHDFHYAQQALRYGVHDYILKPIDEGELAATLKKLTGTLALKRIASLTGDKLAADSIFETLVKGSFKEEDIRALCSALELEEAGMYVYVLAELHLGAAEERAAGAKGVTAKEVATACQAAVRHVQSLGKEREPQGVLTYEQQKGLYGCLLHMNSLLSGDSDEHYIFRRLHSTLEEQLRLPVTLYVGDKVERLQHIKESYRAANEALAYKFAEADQAIVHASRVQGTPLYYFDMEAGLYSRLIEKVEENKPEQYAADIDLLFQAFREKRFAPDAVSNAMVRFVIGIINIIRKMNGDEKRLAQLPAMMNWQQQGTRLSDLKQLFLAFTNEASAYIALLRSEQSKGGIEKVKKYIEANYNENISLKGLAGKFYINSVYLGQLFRKTYGVYFNEYLLSIRVREAKKLLRQTDMRMYEVAEKVGFQNADYFVTQFEKLEKVTPTDYRNGLFGKS
ncbi:two-component system, response regulator YesN [Paenibacillus algorifonticola]|uniref:Two-component system, response regulator YesN n=1 Tax=Paenibacillus algorifonticola TaxID=684063 RepID=A0A1I2EV78_9BACL|nr:response regulator [Paenibacillus algorifonticola]SFE96376.1 two-component system, response regulator YesN [Paenibacillus algorifonticola]